MTGLLVAAGSSPARGQAAGTLEVAGLSVLHTKTAPFNARYGIGGGVRVGVWLPRSLLLEAQVDATRTDHFTPGTGFTLAYLGLGLLWQVPGPGPVQPFLRVGAGVLDSQEPCSATTIGTCGSFSAAAGGAGVHLPLSGALRLRAEGGLRHRPGFDYTSIGASLGVSWSLGKVSGESGPAIDTDRDGVDDRRDRCAGTPLGALVDGRGCPTDFDGDGVIDGIDRCPRSVRGQPVDPFGCPVTDALESGYRGKTREQHTGRRTVGKTS